MTLLKKTCWLVLPVFLSFQRLPLRPRQLVTWSAPTLEDVMNSLTDAGYEVREIEADDDELEAVMSWQMANCSSWIFRRKPA
jgi:hypothetical protein